MSKKIKGSQHRMMTQTDPAPEGGIGTVACGSRQGFWECTRSKGHNGLHKYIRVESTRGTK